MPHEGPAVAFEALAGGPASAFESFCGEPCAEPQDGAAAALIVPQDGPEALAGFSEEPLPVDPQDGGAPPAFAEPQDEATASLFETYIGACWP